jgi:uncharacterized protein (DUF4415 family)
MKREYDFSKGKRGPAIAPDRRKQRITIRFDVDIIDHFKQLVLQAGGGNYQTLINDALLEHIGKTSRPVDESTLRRVLREELHSPRDP